MVAIFCMNPDIGSNPAQTNNQGRLKNWKDHAGCDVRSCLSSDDRVIGSVFTRPWHCSIAALFLEIMPHYNQPKGS